jgi:RNA polymerase sigma factor (sigma-70 family)
MLLNDLRTFGNQTVWSDFDARYRRIIAGFARRFGLDAELADEVAQVTLSEFARDYRRGRYDRRRGRLSTWIIGIARHRIIDVQRARGRRAGGRGSSAIVQLPDEHELTQAWQQERDQAIFDRAMQRLRAATRTKQNNMTVFERVALQGESPAIVAQELGIAIDQIYRIKNRIIERLRRLVTQVEQEYVEP